MVDISSFPHFVNGFYANPEGLEMNGFAVAAVVHSESYAFSIVSSRTSSYPVI